MNRPAESEYNAEAGSPWCVERSGLFSDSGLLCNQTMRVIPIMPKRLRLLNLPVRIISERFYQDAERALLSSQIDFHPSI
jgi:hypothetical protein